MTHRERVLMALRHEQPDRCPMQVSFTPEFSERVRKDMGLPSSAHNPHGGGNSYVLERALEQDVLVTSVGWANSYYQETNDYTDEWGVRWHSAPYQTRFGQGVYTEVVGHPLADEDALKSYKAPDPTRPALYEDATRLIAQHKRDYFIVGAVVTTVFETAWALRGLDNLLVDFVAKPELADAILDIPFRYHRIAARTLAALGVDMIWLGDDVGTQTAMMVSPALWRRMLKPRMVEIIRDTKAANSGVRIAYHSDGVIDPIIPDLIEIGVDVLNPVQPACMDPARLKKQYGDRLCFWGSIDEQHTLPFGTPGDVAREVKTRLETVGRGGGLIIGPTHHVQLDTPLENFWAMVKAVTGD